MDSWNNHDAQEGKRCLLKMHWILKYDMSKPSNEEKKKPTYTTAHSASRSCHCSSSSETPYRHQPKLISKQIEYPTNSLGLELKIENHKKLLHNL